MKVSLTVWTVSADADGGTQGASFASEREGEDWIIGMLDSEASREGLDAWLADNPDSNFFDYVEDHRHNDLDTFNIDSQVLEFDLPVLPVPDPVRVFIGLEGGLVQGATANEPRPRLVASERNYGVHMSHCGPLNDGRCKYGEDEICPACLGTSKPSSQALTICHGEAVLLAQTVATIGDDPFSTRLVLSRIVDLLGNIIAALQVEATKKEN